MYDWDNVTQSEQNDSQTETESSQFLMNMKNMRGTEIPVAASRDILMRPNEEEAKNCEQHASCVAELMKEALKGVSETLITHPVEEQALNLGNKLFVTGGHRDKLLYLHGTQVASEAKRKDFVAYLKNSGIISMLSKFILMLLEEVPENIPPAENLLEDFIIFCGYKLAARDVVDQMKLFIDELNKNISDLEEESTELKSRLEVYEELSSSYEKLDVQDFVHLEPRLDFFDDQFPCENLACLKPTYLRKVFLNKEYEDAPSEVGHKGSKCSPKPPPIPTYIPKDSGDCVKPELTDLDLRGLFLRFHALEKERKNSPVYVPPEPERVKRTCGTLPPVKLDDDYYAWDTPTEQILLPPRVEIKNRKYDHASKYKFKFPQEGRLLVKVHKDNK